MQTLRTFLSLLCISIVGTFFLGILRNKNAPTMKKNDDACGQNYQPSGYETYFIIKNVLNL